MAIVYKHYRKDDNILFYVGIGVSKKRAHSLRSRNELWHNIVKKHGFYVEFYRDNVTNEEAKEIEISLIEHYGRLDKNSGILCNMTDGGDLRVFSDETKKRISNSLKGKIQSEETIEKRRLSLINTWKCEKLRELKRNQTIALHKSGIIGNKGKPSKKKGRPFDGDRVKLSISLKKAFENKRPHNFLFIDNNIKMAILDDFKNGINRYQLHKKYELNRKVIDRIIYEKSN